MASTPEHRRIVDIDLSQGPPEEPPAAHYLPLHFFISFETGERSRCFGMGTQIASGKFQCQDCGGIFTKPLFGRWRVSKPS